MKDGKTLINLPYGVNYVIDKKPKLIAKKIKPINLPDSSSLLFDSSERILTEFLIDNLREAEEEFIQQIQNE